MADKHDVRVEAHHAECTIDECHPGCWHVRALSELSDEELGQLARQMLGEAETALGEVWNFCQEHREGEDLVQRALRVFGGNK